MSTVSENAEIIEYALLIEEYVYFTVLILDTPS